MPTQIKNKKQKIINMKLNFFFQIPNPLSQPFTVQSPQSACSNSSKIVTYIIWWGLFFQMFIQCQCRPWRCFLSPTYRRTSKLGANLTTSKARPSVTLKGHNAIANNWIKIGKQRKVWIQSKTRNKHFMKFIIKQKMSLTYKIALETFCEPSHGSRKRLQSLALSHLLVIVLDSKHTKQNFALISTLYRLLLFL